MFTMDVPYVPMQETPIVLAQATTPGTSVNPQPDYILKACQETESRTVNPGDLASFFNDFNPAGGIKNYIQNRDNRPVKLSDIKNIFLLEGPKHGKLSLAISNYGGTTYHYDPVPEYVGKDRAVFMAEFEGKRYKIVVNFIVNVIVDEREQLCPPSKLIKVTKPSSGRANYNLNAITVSYQPNPSLKRDAAEARRPLASR